MRNFYIRMLIRCKNSLDSYAFKLIDRFVECNEQTNVFVTCDGSEQGIEEREILFKINAYSCAD